MKLNTNQLNQITNFFAKIANVYSLKIPEENWNLLNFSWNTGSTFKFKPSSSNSASSNIINMALDQAFYSDIQKLQNASDELTNLLDELKDDNNNKGENT